LPRPFAITALGRGRLIAQVYVAGESLNKRDPVLAQIRDDPLAAGICYLRAEISEIGPNQAKILRGR
jgi:protocatechuate 3,4-dioxygenase beta subunit